MTLWLNTLLPTLLPFLILTGFLIHTDGIEKIFSPFRIFWNKGMGLSCSGAYAFVLGMLCGYPMGAKIASDLYQYGKISKREAEYLLTFSNNASPALFDHLSCAYLPGRKNADRKNSRNSHSIRYPLYAFLSLCCIQKSYLQRKPRNSSKKRRP